MTFTCGLKFGANERKNIASELPDSCARVGLIGHTYHRYFRLLFTTHT